MKKKQSAVQSWVSGLTIQQQALLFSGIRGADSMQKNDVSKCIVRFLRGAVLKPAGKWNGTNDANGFMWGDYDTPVQNKKGDVPVFAFYTNWFWRDHDHLPHHFIMHLFHCAEVLGYKHPDLKIRAHWLGFYRAGCDAFHLNPESEKQMDKRLNDFQ